MLGCWVLCAADVTAAHTHAHAIGVVRPPEGVIDAAAGVARLPAPAALTRAKCSVVIPDRLAERGRMR